MVPNFIRMKKVDPNRPYHGIVNAAAIIAYKPYGEKDNMTEVILNNGHSFVSNETIPEFEERLGYAIKPYYID
jgi:hypothetical protein